jgi:hypothetical protein
MEVSVPDGDVKQPLQYDGPCVPSRIKGYIENPNPMSDVTVSGSVIVTVYQRGPSSDFDLFDFLSGLIYKLAGGIVKGLEDFPWREINKATEQASAVIKPSRYAWGITNIRLVHSYSTPVAYGLSFDVFSVVDHTMVCYDEIRYAETDCVGTIARVPKRQCIQLAVDGSLYSPIGSIYLPLVVGTDTPTNIEVTAGEAEPAEGKPTGTDQPSAPSPVLKTGHWSEEPRYDLVWTGTAGETSILPYSSFPPLSSNFKSGPAQNLNHRFDVWESYHPEYRGGIPQPGDIRYGSLKFIGYAKVQLMKRGSDGLYNNEGETTISLWKQEYSEWIVDSPL